MVKIVLDLSWKWNWVFSISTEIGTKPDLILHWGNITKVLESDWKNWGSVWQLFHIILRQFKTRAMSFFSNKIIASTIVVGL